MDHRKLGEAAKALERADKAAWLAEQYPHGWSTPCRHQLKAAQAEIDCALALIKEATKAA